MKKLIKSRPYLSGFLTCMVLFLIAASPGIISNLKVSTSANYDFATASTVPYFDASKNLVSSAVTPTQLGYVDFTSSGQAQLNLKQDAADTRYVKGNISGAVTIDRADGSIQICTSTATVTGITISNLGTQTGMILLIDNSGGYSNTFDSTEIIATTETGVYACAFYNDNGTIYFMGKGERQN